MAIIDAKRTGISAKLKPRSKRTALGFALLTMFPVLLSSGCGSGKFFSPVCQAYGTCTSGGGGGGGGSSTNASYAYVANYNSGTIAGYPVPKTAFTKLTGTAYNLGTPPSAIAANPRGTLLYVATAAGGVFVYVINSANGTLALGNGSQPVTSTLNPTWMTVDPSGNWLFMVSNSSPQLLIFQINPTNGVLTQTNQGTISLSPGNPTQVYVTPNAGRVLVGLGLGGTDTFQFNASTGVVSNQQHIRPLGASSDNTFGADNNSKYIFIGEAGTGIRVLTNGSNGSLNEISGSPFTSNTQLGPNSIVVNPSNTFVYVAYRTTDSIAAYSLGTSGKLTQITSSPFQTGSAPTQMSLDSTGAYLFVMCAGGNPDLQVFSFDAATPGKLDTVTSTATGADPTAPISLAVVP